MFKIQQDRKWIPDPRAMLSLSNETALNRRYYVETNKVSSVTIVIVTNLEQRMGGGSVDKVQQWLLRGYGYTITMALAVSFPTSAGSIHLPAGAKAAAP